MKKEKEESKEIISNEELKKMLSNSSALLNRVNLAQALKTFDGKRDLYKVLGYKKNIRFADYFLRFDRQDIAARIINAFPDGIWTSPPEIMDNSDVELETPFEKEMAEFIERIKLWNYFSRLDKLCGIGNYAVLLIGFKGGSLLSEPVTKINSVDDIIYLMPFSEVNATITRYEENTSNPRYGLPLTYNLQTGGYHGENSSSMSTSSLNVHHSRVIHLAENTLENNVFGIPRLRKVLNRLDDLEKVIGGSSEIFWMNGRGGLSVEADKDGNVKNPEKLKEHIEDYVHQLSRVLRTQGMNVKPIEFKIDSPKDHVSVILDAISSATGIPKRILIGSERGELASSQDEVNWNKRLDERRVIFCEKMLIRVFFDKLMELGAIEKKKYDVVWPKLMETSDKDKSAIARDTATAISTYANSMGGDLLVTPEQFVKDVLGMEYNKEEIDKLLKEDREDDEDDDENEDFLK